MKAGPTGSLFGSVTPTDLADEIWAMAKIRVDRRKIDLGEPIKKVGRYAVPVELFTDVTVEVRDARRARGRRAAARGVRAEAGPGGDLQPTPEPEAEAPADARARRRGRSATLVAESVTVLHSPCGGAGEIRTKRPLRAAFSSTAPSGLDGNMRSDLPANGRLRRVESAVVQALFGRVRRWLICRACTSSPRLRRPPRSHRRISMPRSRSSAR